MFASDMVDKRRTRIYLDGTDVTSEALISDDVLLYSPKNFDKPLNFGAHSIKIELKDTLGNVYYTKQENFNLSTATALEEQKSLLQYTGNAQAEFRNEKVDVTTTSYVRGDVHLGGSYKDFLFSGDMHLTNEEKSYLQPQNRFLATFQEADYAKVQIGDAYPQFPSLLVSGKRVRGITGSVTLGFFNLDVSYGKTDRAIEGTIGGLISYGDSSAASNRPKETIFERFGGQNPDYVTPMDTLFYRMYTSGTYARNFLAIRPSFGSGENFQFGLTYMKAKDDKGSIAYGMYPKENFVAGADLLLAFDNQKVRWTSQAAFSLENNDISPGNYTDEEIDEFKGVNDPTKTPQQIEDAKKEADDLKKIAKIVRSFITVNSGLSPLNPIKGIPSLAYESELSLNYLNNYLRAMVFRRGIAYTSYGNDFVQNDIAGINISDRVRMFNNKIMASVSYETKSNNTQNDANTPTTTYNTLNTSVTAYPSAELPSFTVGYGLNTRKNPIDLAIDTTRLDSLSIANEKTNRFFIAANYDFQMVVRNSLTASISISNKKDNTFYKRDQDNFNFSTLISSFFSIPLQTTIGVIVSQTAAYSALQDSVRAYLSTTQKQTFNYQTISLGARYRMMNDRLNLLATVAPSFGDFKRLLIQAGAEYQVVENHYLVSQFDFIKNSGRASDAVFSILYRFMF
jgi:archaellum component FlaF (FlaF/FlaG flagellin family)